MYSTRLHILYILCVEYSPEMSSCIHNEHLDVDIIFDV